MAGVREASGGSDDWKMEGPLTLTSEQMKLRCPTYGLLMLGSTQMKGLSIVTSSVENYGYYRVFHSSYFRSISGEFL